MTNQKKEEKRKKWKNHIKQWESSGLSQAEYCRKYKLSDKSFYYWKRRLKSAGKTISFLQIPDSAFQETIPDKIHLNNSLKILIHNGLQIEINDNFNPETLKKAVEVLRCLR